ncbi:uncharacterized protein BXZ73DRAFT_49024, partial [Epithele typhae]|uniref:uncharacterized protein n=1 Tax=Epithele typhae TaxID=378194 RepID=UPI0020078FB4
QLRGLYSDLFLQGPTDVKKVRSWQRQERPVRDIMSTFEAHPPPGRGQCYLWFLQHPTIPRNPAANRATSLEENMDSDRAATLRTGWTLFGGSPLDDLDVIKKGLRRMPIFQQACHLMDFMALTYSHPPPAPDDWVGFGFVATAVETQEISVRRLRNSLARRLQLCVGYARGYPRALPTPSFGLTSRHGSLRRRDGMFPKQRGDVFGSTRPGDKKRDPSWILPTLRTDHGYDNRANVVEIEPLDDLYVRLFAHLEKGAGPLYRHAWTGGCGRT